MNDSLATLCASAAAGVVARVPCHPIDTAKSQLQVQSGVSGSAGAPPPHRNFLQAMANIWRVEGLGGLYRGFAVTAIGSGPATCLYLTSYETIKGAMNSSLPGSESFPFAVNFAAGLGAEAFSCVLWVPIDVVKERMQVQRVMLGADAARSDTRSVMKAIFKEEGLVGLYRGYGATLLSFGPFSALYFLFYEEQKELAHRALGTRAGVNELPVWAYLFSSCSAGAAASLVTSPLDMAKLRLQVQRSSMGSGRVSFHYRNTFDALGQIYAREGMRGLFQGAGARIAFHVPSTAITMSLFEVFRNNLKRQE